MAENTLFTPFDRFYWRVLRNLAAAYILLVAFVYLFQRKLQYFPDSSRVDLPTGERYFGIETVDLRTSDGLQVIGWYWPGTRPVTLAIFHGNAGHRGHRLDWLADLHSLGCGVFILDYRGYGGSEGSPTEAGLFRDAEAAVLWLKRQNDNQLVYFGESLGCGVAVELATRHPPAALILQSGFLSALEVARKAYPYLPVGLLMKDRFDCREKIHWIQCPLLMIHGDRDSLIPLRLGRALFDLAKQPKDWYAVAGANHNDLQWVGGRNYLQRIDGFLRQHLNR